MITFLDVLFWLQLEVKRLKTENNEMRTELEIEREKLHTLEAAFDLMRKQGLSNI